VTRASGRRPAAAPAQRGGQGSAGGPPREGRGTRSFRSGVLAGIGGLLAVATVAGVLALVLLRPDGVEAEVARLRAEEIIRDREQITSLTEQARETVATVTPTLDAMASVLPAQDGQAVGRRQADPATADGWVGQLTQAAAAYDDPPSGSTATNVARGALAAAADLLAESAAAYRSALEAPAPDRSARIARAAALRDLGVQTWSVGATQLDAINIEAGNGHQHVYLSGGSGAFGPDGAAEGEGAQG